MKKWMKAVLCISLSFMCLFACIGFARITQSLRLEGSANVTPPDPDGIYISKVVIHSSKGVAASEPGILLPTTLQSSLQVNSTGATITYEITVHNKTDVTYWYLGAKSLREAAASNQLIGMVNGITFSTRDNASSNSTRFDTEDWVPPQTERVFYVTFTYGSNAVGSISTAINFRFGLHMQSFSDEFLRVLNDKESEFGYYYLANAFEDQYAENKSTVIGNVGEDKEIFDNLFSSNLSIEVNGSLVPVTVLVERKNVDKNTSTGDSYANGSSSGCEYTVYLTTDNLDGSGTATVYAVSYTCSNGVWYQIGELYEGTCPIADYDPSDNQYEGAFTVSKWVASSKTYHVTNDISYKVGSVGSGTTADMISSLTELMSVKDDNFYNMVNNNSSKLLVPVCRIIYSYSHRPDGRYDERENSNNVNKEGYAILKEAFDQIKPYCLIENGAQNVRIENARSLTRAELIPMLERIQQAYDYYLSINPNG